MTWPDSWGVFLGERLPREESSLARGTRDGYVPPAMDAVVTMACGGGVSGRVVRGRVGPAGCLALLLPTLRPRLGISRQETSHGCLPLTGDVPWVPQQHGFPRQIVFLPPCTPYI